MKKINLVIAVAFALTVVSCKKERTCDCTTTSTSSPGTTTTTTSKKWTIEKDSKKNAKRDSQCFDRKEVNTQTIAGTSVTFTDDIKCTLK